MGRIPDRREFSEALLKDEMVPSVIDAFATATTKQAVADGASEFEADFLGFWARRSCTFGFEMVKQHAESPLERVFLLALMLGFMKWEPMGLNAMPTVKDDAQEAIDEYRSDHEVALQAMANYRSETGETHLMGMVDRLQKDEKLRSEIGSPDILIRHIFEEMFQTWDRFHLLLQPRFTTLRVDGRSMRADALVWVPADPSFRVVFELDGYDYHSDKQAFTKDRRRDRILASAGYRVVRFSGQEVFEDPISTASEAYTYLVSLRQPSE